MDTTLHKVTLRATLDKKRLGKKLKNDMNKIEKSIASYTSEQLSVLEKSGTIVVEGHTLDSNDVIIVCEYSGDTTYFEAAWSEDVLIILDVHSTPALESESIVCEVSNRIQRLRKAAGLLPLQSDLVVYYKLEGQDDNEIKEIQRAIKEWRDEIERKTHTEIRQLLTEKLDNLVVPSGMATSKIKNSTFSLILVHKSHNQN